MVTACFTNEEFDWAIERAMCCGIYEVNMAIFVEKAESVILSDFSSRDQCVFAPSAQIASCIESGVFTSEDSVRRQFTSVLEGNKFAAQKQIYKFNSICIYVLF